MSCLQFSGTLSFLVGSVLLIFLVLVLVFTSSCSVTLIRSLSVVIVIAVRLVLTPVGSVTSFSLSRVSPLLFVSLVTDVDSLRVFSLTPVVLHYLCLTAYSGVQHILCCVFVLLVFVLCTLCQNPYIEEEQTTQWPNEKSVIRRRTVNAVVKR